MTRLTRVLAAVLTVPFACGALAQGAYPGKPVTVVVGFEPGGGTDTTARILQKPLGDQLGQQVIVENRAGAGGNIAVDYVAKSAPDGYMLVLANVGALSVNPHIMKTPYDPLKDLTPISMAAVFANVLVVQPTLPVKSVADYVKLGRERREGVTYASSGIGGAGHLAGELLRGVAKTNLVHVPYKGGGPAMQGFLGGQVDSFFATPISSISQIRSGKARAIATTGAKRAKLMPDVPTIAESGYPGYEALNWYGFLGPANMPKEVVERLNREIVKALANPDAVAAMNKTGVEPQSSSPAEFAKYIEREYQTWGKVVKDAGIKPQ
jgi:tripartite-type tricarboxylate transporter receptor subunit TctC